MHCLPVEHQQDLDRLPAYYWWHRHRIEMVVGLLGRFYRQRPGQTFNYCDVGGGTGATTTEIVKGLRDRLKLPITTNSTVCLDGDPGLAVLQKNKEIRHLLQDIEKDWDLAVGHFDLMTLLDVIEHVEDPVLLLGRCKSQLNSNGIGVISVPAYNFLFSQWDVALGHKRRYTRARLRSECKRAGFRVLWDSYLYSYMLPAAFLRRAGIFGHQGAAEFPQIPGFLNTGLRAIGACERRITRGWAIPWGTSVMAVVQP